MSRTLLFFLRLALPAVLTVVLVRPSAAQSGETRFGFLQLEPSARAAALGGSFAAVYGPDVNALFYNPALLNETMSRTLSLSYLNHVAGLDAGFAAYAHDLGGLGTLGGGVRFLSWGEVEGADETGASTGTFSASDVALTTGIARALDDHLRYGVALHAVASRIDSYGASALGADAGVAYVVADHDLVLSASVNNLGLTLDSFGETEDGLPLDVRLGVSKRLQHLPLLVSLSGFDLDDLVDGDDGGGSAGGVLRHLAVGGEFQFSEAFNVRVGYNHRRHQELKMRSRLDLAGLGVGAGIKVSRLHVDYAYTSWSSLGGLHQLTVRTRL